MLPNKNRQWVMAGKPSGADAVEERHFRLQEIDVPKISDGEVLIRTLYLSVAPVMRRYLTDGAGIEKPLHPGEVMRGRGVGQIVESRHPDFQEGDIIQGKLGWQDYSVNDASPYYMMYKVRQRVAPVSTAIGVLGMTGFTSYVGLLRFGDMKKGDHVLVSGAAGGVGSNVGNIARIKGASTLVGIAGSADKCRLLIDKLGYDKAINYRSDDVATQIAAYFPNGIDVFFDNVGGPILDAALMHINTHARVVSCGRISQYLKNDGEQYALKNWAEIGHRNARMEGFLIYEHEDLFPQAEQDMASWIADGRMTYLEDRLEGLENMPAALIRLYEGNNQGKQIVRVDPDADKDFT